MTENEAPVVIIGAGLSGLACAVQLTAQGVDVLVLDGDETPGGRVQTDEVDGFLLDRGFQVFLTSYPEAQALLDYDELDLRPFIAGASIAIDGKRYRYTDPWRHPGDLLRTAFAPVGSWLDALRVLRLRKGALEGDGSRLLAAPEQTTLAALQERGFSPRVIERFFRPFYRGVFLEGDLATSSRKFDFTFRMFSMGKATLPAAGMGAIPAQLVERLPAHALRLKTRVHRVTPASGEGPCRVELGGGESIAAAQVVVATTQRAAAALLGEPSDAPPAHSTACVYFDAPTAPLREPILLLNGTKGGVVNSVCVPSLLSQQYAPPGRHLVSVALRISAPDARVGDIATVVCNELRATLGASVDAWRPLKTYCIEEALPAQPAGHLDPPTRPARCAPSIYRCGDYLDLASINGAFASGRRAAEAILEDRRITASSAQP